jgi:Zn-dependent protease with chaperone function
MNFFEHQERARRNTGLLVFYFVVAVVLIVVAVDFIVLFAYRLQSSRSTYEMPDGQFDPSTLLILTTVGTLALIGLATLWKVSSLSSGGSAVADMMGGMLVSPDTRDPLERRLINVIEEMALAAGISVPAIYVLPSESSINAFAAGNSPSTAAIAVSRGALENLSRDELQGVVAHEFSHVFNGDMRLNLRLMGILFGILVLAMVGRILLHTSGGRSRRKSGGGAIILVGLGLLVIGYVGVFFAQLIKSAISRQREFLADASAVQFTRNPSGILGALVKIRDGAGSRLENTRTEEVSHLLFAQGLTSLFATHPPLDKRIQAIDASGSLAQRPSSGGGPAMQTSLASEAAATPLAPVSGFASGSTPKAALASIGQPGTEDLAIASGLLAKIPAELHSRLESPAGARTVVYALLLDEAAGARARQIGLLGDEATATDTIHPQIVSLGLEARLPLAGLAVPALRQMPANDRSLFLSRVHTLVVEDAKVQPFELLMQLFLEHVLGKRESSDGGHRTLRSALPDLLVVLSFLAHAGRHVSEVDAQRALRSGLDHLGGGIDATLLPESKLGPEVMRSALSALRVAAVPVRSLVMGASAACALSDAQVTLEEWEILRVLGAVLECPLPPAISNLKKS